MRTGLRDKWDTLSPRAKMLVTTGAIAAAILVPIIYSYIHSTIYSAKITLTFAPKSSSARIGTLSAHFGNNDVKPGTYDVVISKQGFETYKETVTVKKGDAIVVEAALESNDPSTANWYNDHPEDYTIAQGIGDRRADNSARRMKAEFPIVDILPIVGLYSAYRVDYGPSPTKKDGYALFITYQTAKDKQRAIDAVAEKGYDVDEYEVIYEQEASGTYGSVSISGSGNLLARGLSGGAVVLIEESLSEHYAVYENTSITSITISDDVTHGTSEDTLTDTYTASLTLNDEYTRKLEVIIKNGDYLVVRTGAADGTAMSTIFEGSL